MFDWISNDWCSTFMLAFGHFLWQSTLIAVLLMVVMRAASTSAARYCITLSALLLMTVCPVITFVWLSQPTHSAADVRPDPARKNKVTAPPSTAEVPIVGPAFGVFNTPLESPITLPPSFPLMEVVAPVEQSAWERIAPLLTSLYLSGVVLMLFRLAIGLWGGRTLRGQSTPVTEASLLSALRRQVDALGLKLQPALAYCEHVTVPTVMGIFRPMILLPLSLTSGLTSDQLESILAHELAHLRRYDHLVNLLQRVIESLLFFHPAVWWVSNRVREEREHCCDDLVIACGALPFDYAASLLRVAELSRPSTLRPAVAAVSLLATGNKPSNLRQRVARLLGESADSHLRFRRQWPVIFLCIVCVILAGAALKVGAQSAEVDPQPAIAYLPGNITVELVGVTFHTSSNKPEPDWWTPSGGPLAKVPKPRKSFLGATAPEKHRVFAVKVGGTPESTAVNVRVSRADDRVDFSTWGGGYAGKESDPPLFWTAGPFIHGKETTVRVMLLVDDWGPVQQVSTEANRIDEPKLLPIYQRCYANIAPQKAEERSRQTALTFHWPTDQDYLATFEIWAVDKQGTRLRSGGSAGPINAREFTFDGPLAEIDHFEYRLRPFRHWVTFENVSVQPGHHTPVKVKVESLPGETNEAQEHAAAEEAIEVEAASDEPVVAYPGIEFRIAAGETDHRLTLVARRGKEQLGWFDFALHQLSETSPEPEDGSFHVMLLPMSRTVHGRILDEEGMPLAKASVQIASLEHAVNSRADSWIHKKPGTVPQLEGAVTGEDGTFVLRLPRDASASLKVSHPDRVTEWINVSKDEVNFADVKLSKATIVVGRVTDSRTGMPIAGIDIGLRMGDRPTSKLVQLPAGRANVNKAPVEVAVFVGGIATTDANGDYKVSGLRNGEYTIEFMKGVDPTLAAPCITNVVLESGDTFHADFELPVGKHLTGRVVDGETGEPIFGCTVTYSGHSRNGTTGLETKTNRKGEFKLLVPPGRCRVDAMADHFSVEGSVRNLDVLDDGEPESVVLKAGPSNKPVPEGF